MDSHLVMEIKEALAESLGHTALMLPVLLVAFILMEMVNHSDKAAALARAARHAVLGPVVAAALGLLPQCGFSVVATTLFLDGLIPTGSLLAAYIATSDEALPILLGSADTLPWVVPLLATKLAWGAVAGIAVNLALGKRVRPKGKKGASGRAGDSHEARGCCVGDSGPAGFKDYVSHAALRTARVGALVFVLSAILHFAGHMLSSSLDIASNQGGLVQPVLAAVLGLIPSCATSVAMAEAFRSGLMSFPAVLSGLTSNAGVGLLVLIKENRQPGQSLSIVALLVASAAVIGLLASLLL